MCQVFCYRLCTHISFSHHSSPKQKEGAEKNVCVCVCVCVDNGRYLINQFHFAEDQKLSKHVSLWTLILTTRHCATPFT